MSDRRHRREAINAAATRQPHQQRLGLIVACVSGENGSDSVGGHLLGNQSIARATRRCQDARLWLGAGPDENFVLQSEALRLFGNRAGLGGGRGPKAVIHGQDNVRGRIGIPAPQPVAEENHEGSAVGAAGDRQHAWLFSRPLKWSEQGIGLVAQSDDRYLSWPQHYVSAAKRVACLSSRRAAARPEPCFAHAQAGSDTWSQAR